MIGFLKAYLKKSERKRLYTVFDLSFKLNVSNFGLAIMAFVYKRYDKRHKIWRTSAMPFAFGWAPKDDEASWSLLLVSVIRFYSSMGIDLLAAIGACFWDDSAGARLAHRRVFPDKKYCRCLRHQLAALKKLASRLGGASYGRCSFLLLWARGGPA